jgi:hypothetical protein
MNAIGGMKVYVNPILCNRVFLRWARTHRKRRINKKWRKRYGAIFRPCPGIVLEFYSAFYLCPCALAAVRKNRSVTRG